MAAEAEPLALYIHWPFCLSKCPYCDFNSHVAAASDHGRWRAALLRELDHAADMLGGPGLEVGLKVTQRRHVGVEDFRRPRRNVADG